MTYSVKDRMLLLLYIPMTPMRRAAATISITPTGEHKLRDVYDSKRTLYHLMARNTWRESPAKSRRPIKKRFLGSTPPHISLSFLFSFISLSLFPFFSPPPSFLSGRIAHPAQLCSTRPKRKLTRQRRTLCFDFSSSLHVRPFRVAYEHSSLFRIRRSPYQRTNLTKWTGLKAAEFGNKLLSFYIISQGPALNIRNTFLYLFFFLIFLCIYR